MTGAVASYSDLQRSLRSLPDPTGGMVRVFRGQTRRHDRMLPTLLRGGPAPEDAIWPLYAAIMAHDLERRVGADAMYLGEDLALITTWVQAIKQHYGPGTSYLDVTHSPAVAAWFALHRAESVEVQAVYGPPGPVDLKTDILGHHEILRFRPYTEEAGYLYVFHVPQEHSPPTTEHGTLIDLSDAPPAFSSSPRIQAQEACLLYADQEIDDGDLSKFFVRGTPIPVKWPLEGCPEMAWSTNDMFPPATKDDWYARFVAVPLAPRLDRSAISTIVDHPIQVGLYMPQGRDHEPDQSLLDDLSSRLVCLQPPLVFADLLSSWEGWVERTGDQTWRRIQEATGLFLEGPLYVLPEGPSRANIGLLVTGLEDTAVTKDALTGDLLPGATLRNVFVEMSTLEAAGWERAETPDGSLEVVRGVWLQRESDQFLVMVFFQSFPGATMRAVGPARVLYDRRVRRFLVQPPARPGKPQPLAEMPLLEQPFLEALALVRTLSPGWKVGHRASLRVDDRSLVRIEWALGELASLRGLGGPIRHYHALRQLGGKGVFFGDAPFTSVATGDMLEVAGDFVHMDPDDIERAAEGKFAMLNRSPTP